ncbi:2881_t:CDS:2 [Rhizophagus irregularis]|nr:2881_t:CDS:2 [Rhizophagus irregularis]
MSRPFDMQDFTDTRTPSSRKIILLNSGIGYWNLEMKDFDWVPGDWGRFGLPQTFLLLNRLFFGVLKHVEFR